MLNGMFLFLPFFLNQTVSNVFLVITLQGSGQFQGYAKMTSDICYPRSSEWRDNSGRLGGEFSVQWIKK